MTTLYEAGVPDNAPGLSQPDTGAQRPPAPGWALPALVVVLAASLRVIAYAGQRSFWVDEASLALNVVSRSLGGLARPLAYDQSAPLLFLWAERIVTRLMGPNEFALRLLPLAAGIATLPLLYLLARRFLSREATLVATALVGLAPGAIYFSNEAKPYASDACVALVLLLLAVRWIERPEYRGRYTALLLSGLVAVWWSVPALFVLAAIGFAVLLGPVRQGHARLFAAVGMGASWLLSFGLAYLTVYGAASHSPYMQRFWEPSFLTPWRAGFLPHVAWAAQEVFWFGFIGHPIGWGVLRLPAWLVHGIVGALAALLVIGAVRFARTRGPGIGVLLVGPLGIALLASALRIYPTALRLLFFAIPCIAVLIAAGLEAARQTSWWPRVLRPWPCLAVVLLAGPTLNSVVDVTRTEPPEHIRPLVALLQSQVRAGDALYVTSGALPAWAFYSTNWVAPDSGRLRWFERVGSSGGEAFHNERSRGRPVSDEGRDLVERRWDAQVLLGVHTGIEYRTSAEPSDTLPDPQWAENEVERIEATGAERLWLLVGHLRWPTECQLMARLSDRGWHPAFRHRGFRAGLFRYERGPLSWAMQAEIDSAIASARKHGLPEALATCPMVY